MLFYLASISTLWLGSKVDGGNDSELKTGWSHGIGMCDGRAAFRLVIENVVQAGEGA